MKLLDKLATTEGALQGIERILRYMPAAVGTALSGGAGGWAAQATLAFNQYQPASWVFGALLGAMTFLAAWYFWLSSRLALARYEFLNLTSKTASNINPLETTFTKEVIDINHFRPPIPDSVKGKVFVDCQLRGPAVVLFIGRVVSSNTRFVNCEFVKVKDGPMGLYNILVMEDTTIQGGIICNMTIMISETSAKSFPPGGLWLN